jgi:glutathione peroxidase
VFGSEAAMRGLIRFTMALLAMGGVAGGSRAAAQSGTAWDKSFQAIDGTPMPLAGYRGKVLLVVNTASFCGFTQQYAALQKLHEAYESRGLIVIGAPSNDFGGQEPKSEAEVKSFCEGAFGITFPLTSKIHVRGSERHPFYTWASETLGSMNAPWWNFHKYLVGRDGKLVSAFGTRTEPQAPDVIKAIEAELAKPAPTASLQP